MPRQSSRAVTGGGRKKLSQLKSRTTGQLAVSVLLFKFKQNKKLQPTLWWGMKKNHHHPNLIVAQRPFLVAVTSLGVSTATEPDDSPQCQCVWGCAISGGGLPRWLCLCFSNKTVHFFGCCSQPGLNFALVSKCQRASARGSAQDQSEQSAPGKRWGHREGREQVQGPVAICTGSAGGRRPGLWGGQQNCIISQAREEDRGAEGEGCGDQISFYT